MKSQKRTRQFGGFRSSLATQYEELALQENENKAFQTIEETRKPFRLTQNSNYNRIQRYRPYRCRNQGTKLLPHMSLTQIQMMNQAFDSKAKGNGRYHNQSVDYKTISQRFTLEQVEDQPNRGDSSESQDEPNQPSLSVGFNS